MKDRKIVIIILLMLTITFTIMGTTFAYFSWQTSESQKTEITFSIDKKMSCSADIGGAISSNDTSLMPDSCTGSHAIKRTLTTRTQTTDNISLYMDLWLDIKSISSGLSNSNNFKYSLTTSNNSCSTNIVTSGTFNGLNTGDKVELLSSIESTISKTDTYYLYIWLDETETSTTTQNQTFSLSLNGECSDKQKVYSESILNGAVPELDDGMIPVVIDNSGSETTIKTVKRNNPSWYNYENKLWANVVLTTNDSRSKYLNTSDVFVSEDDILAYYVWIPRYKYKIWTTTTSSTGKEQTIDIIFEDKNTSKSTGTTVGSYLTHPAFIFGSTELNGIWVGKFETSTDLSDKCYISPKYDNCNNNNQSPRIVPNVRSLRYQVLNKQYLTAQKFGTSTYGSTEKVDAYMMKNSEWGAVAYLSHSVYGINGEVYNNNSKDYYTGRSGGNVGGSVNTVANQYSDQTSTNQYISNGYYTYDGREIDSSGNIGNYASDRTLGTKASTTGNITGIYDMSGGAEEYVMGVYIGASSTYGATKNSAVNDANYAGFTNNTKPDIKYYNEYSNKVFGTLRSENIKYCTMSTCGGEALFETAGWYNDDTTFVSPAQPWFARGGGPGGIASSGIFSSFNYTGYADNLSFRSVIAYIK